MKGLTFWRPIKVPHIFDLTCFIYEVLPCLCRIMTCGNRGTFLSPKSTKSNQATIKVVLNSWFSDLTGTDFSEGAIELARNLAARNGFSHIKFLIDDVLETKLENKFQLVMDKGTLDAIGLHPDGPVKRLMYWDAVAKLVAPHGILVITSCNKTKDELLHEVDQEAKGSGRDSAFKYLDHVRTYPTIMFGGVEGSRVCTVAFCRK
ncbi:hypothetical protein HPP92_023113 [Vanilla planifolia]|uniref:Methyltransferase domain-containing protein n=1 Tax=Vanilla planifolia TaxID=51239 RepID=A0A835PPR2_VANPL|nr:hypothetical protein HPP92_023113 [Vanilla planifolia]